jgi:CRISPR-associated protein Cmr4
MNKMIMTLFARTPVHVGAGNSVGAVDSPIQRERHTRIPIIPGSSLKGVLADLWPEDMEKVKRGEKEVLVRKIGSTEESLFGQEENKNEGRVASSGALLIGEARVLAFPVRSAKGMFAWITCPLALHRFKREWNAAFTVPEIGKEEAMAFDALKLKGQVVLEEYNFNAPQEPPTEIVEAFKPLVPNDSVWSGIKEQLVIVSDEIFQHFCEHACEVVTRIKINDETGTVDGSALFNQEQVPSETLFYTLVLATGKDDALQALRAKLEEQQWLQVGGGATIGLGFCSTHCMEVE